MITHNKYKFEIIDECPFDGIAVLFVFFICCPAFDQGFADQGVDW